MKNWIDVKDNLPEKKQDVLVYFINSAGRHISYATYEDFAFWSIAETDTQTFKEVFPIVTHWMGLPEPPSL